MWVTEEPAGLTQFSDGMLGDVAREGEGTGEVRRVGSSVVQPEALMLAHLGGGLPGRLYNAAVQHLSDEGGRRRHCNKQTNNTAVQQHNGRHESLSCAAAFLSFTEQCRAAVGVRLDVRLQQCCAATRSEFNI